jgi:hypothetical protein
MLTDLILFFNWKDKKVKNMEGHGVSAWRIIGSGKLFFNKRNNLPGTIFHLFFSYKEYQSVFQVNTLPPAARGPMAWGTYKALRAY